MSEDMHRRKLDSLKKKEAELRKKKSNEEQSLSKLRSEIGRLKRSVTSRTGDSTRRSKQRQIESKTKKAAESEKKIAGFESDLARNFSEQNRVQRQLDQAVARRVKKEDSEAKKRRTEEIRHTKAVTREVEKQNRLYSERLTKEFLSNLPEKIKVLVFAANPVDGDPLRLDQEVRDIGEKIRMARYRDVVDLESRWAVRTEDLFQALNEVKPRIVHFSGHGSYAEKLFFEDDEGNSKPVSKEAITTFISIGADHVQVVFFNACYSQAQAEAAAQHVDVSIGMNAPISDEAARIFAAQFYSAIGFGCSVQRAFEQARTQLMLEDIPEDMIPELFTREGVDTDEVVLVRPDLGGEAD